MTYEENRNEVSRVFEIKKNAFRKLGASFENTMNAAFLPQVRAIGSLGMLTSSEFEQVYDCFQKMFFAVSEVMHGIEQRIEKLEETTREMGGKISSDEIATVAKFAHDFNEQVKESEKKIEEYRRKMKENDLAI